MREEIVNPLRKHVFVRADRVMKLRQLLDKLSSVSGLTSEEKDPEEFLNSLLAQIMRAEPFLKVLKQSCTQFFYLNYMLCIITLAKFRPRCLFLSAIR